MSEFDRSLRDIENTRPIEEDDMSTTTERSLAPLDESFEERLLAELLGVLTVRGTHVPDPDGRVLAAGAAGVIRRPRSARTVRWAASAAAAALLGGGSWLLVGGIDRESPVQVTHRVGRQDAQERPYFDWPGEQWQRSPVVAAAGESAIEAQRFRPRRGDRNRPMFEIRRRDDLWRSGGTERRTSAGRVVHTTSDWADRSATTSVFWNIGGEVWSLLQVPVSSNGQDLELLDDDALFALVDSLVIEDGRVVAIDDAYGVMDDAWVAQWPEWEWLLSETADGLPQHTFSSTRGSIDVGRLPGHEVAVRGAVGVVGTSTVPFVSTSTLVWVENGATMRVEISVQDGPVSDEELITAAESLVPMTRDEFDRKFPMPAAQRSSDLVLSVPRTDVPALRVWMRATDATGAELPDGMGRSMVAWDSAVPKELVLPIATGASSLLIWSGASEEPPGCAQRVDVAQASPDEPVRATLDLTCSD